MEEGLIAALTEKIRGAGSSREVLVKRVANALREEIASGKLTPGTQLVNEVALAQGLEISRPTLREAIRILAREGLLNIKHGVGTFVADEHRLIWGRLDAMRSFTDLIRSVGGVPGDSHLGVSSVPAPAEVAEALDIAPGAPVALIDRVRLIDGDAARDRQRVRGAAEGRAGFRADQDVRRRVALQLPARSLRHDAVALDRRHHGRAGRHGAGRGSSSVRRGTPLLLLQRAAFRRDGPAGAVRR